MRVMVYRGPRQLTLEQADEPVLQDDEVLVEVETAGICGSELEGYLGHSSVRVPPLVMGHEFSGRIAAVGGSSGRLKPGDRVAVNPLIACGSCDRCRSGRGNVCRRRRIVGIHRPGAFAERVAVPAANALVIPPDMDSALGSLAEPLAVSIHALKLGLRPLEELLIYGAGPIGLLTLQAARHMGAGAATVVDLQPARLAHAARLGARAVHAGELEGKWSGLFPDGIDTIIDCVGAQPTRQQAMRLVNPGGTIVMVGLSRQTTELPVNDLVRQELSLLGSYTYSDADFRQALDLLVKGGIEPAGWTERRRLADGPEAFAELADGRAAASKIFLDI